MPFTKISSLQTPTTQFRPPAGGVALPGMAELPQGGAPAVRQAGPAGAAAALPGPAAVRAGAAQRNPAPDTTLRGTGHAGPKAFFSSIGNWFKSHVPHGFGTPNFILPDTMKFALPNGKSCTMRGEQFESMIKALPKKEQAAAAMDLPQTLATRIQHGAQVHQNAVQFGGGCNPKPTAQDVADLALFLKAVAAGKGDNFDEGSMSIEDPNGKLLAFLKSCPENYARSSSHLSDLQHSTLPDGDRNIQRGIDVKPGPDGLPSNHRTVLFGAIPHGDPAKQRLFLKTETFGCRLAIMGKGDRVAAHTGTGDSDRKVRSGDFKEFLGHTFSFIATRGKGSAEGTRKEHLPTSIKTAYQKAVAELKASPYYGKIGFFLETSQADKGGHGVRSLLAKLDEIKNDPKDRFEYKLGMQIGKSDQYSRSLAEIMQPLEDAIAKLGADRDHMDIRLGNEVILQTSDF